MPGPILVIGATGMLGAPVVRSLTDAGFPVRVFTRNAEKARQQFGDSFTIVVGDVLEVSTLEAALDGCSGVHINLGGAAEGPGTANIATTAARTGVTRLTYISGATVSQENSWFPMVAGKYQAEQAIKASGVPYTILRPTWLMESLAQFVREGRATIMGQQPTPVHWIAAGDLARLVTTAYGVDEAANKTLWAFGPEAMPMLEALRRYCAFFYPNVTPSVMPLWLARLMGILTRNEGLKFAAGLFAYFDKIGEAGDPAEANRLLGAPATTLADWMQQRKAAR